MLGCRTRDFKKHESISLEDLVPKDNFYRQVERSIDLEFVRDLVGGFYSSIGRPSIDPIVFFKLQLIAFFEGIRIEAFTQGKHRRSDDSSGVKPEKIDQAQH